MNVHYSQEEWRVIFSQQLQSGLSVRKWCERNNFKAGVRAEMLSSLETEIERCIVGEEEACPICGAQLAKVGESKAGEGLVPDWASHLPFYHVPLGDPMQPGMAGTSIRTDAPEGAKAGGIIYSLVESAKLNHLDTFRYLSYLLEKMPEIDYQYQNDPNILDPYLPWSSELPESCRIQKKKK